MILLQFNLFTIISSFGIYDFSFYIPFMKRFTYWPQLFLGITFNYGLSWMDCNKGEIDIEIIIFYLSAIFWTLGYDTIYGVQDMADDEIIGLNQLQ